MNNKDDNTFWDFYDSAPEEVKDFLTNPETGSTLFDICKNAGLDDELIPDVSNYVTLIIMKKAPLDNFALNLELILGIDPEKATKIATEIDKQLLNNIKRYIVFSEKKEPSFKKEENTENTFKKPPKKIRPEDEDQYREEVKE